MITATVCIYVARQLLLRKSKPHNYNTHVMANGISTVHNTQLINTKVSMGNHLQVVAAGWLLCWQHLSFIGDDGVDDSLVGHVAFVIDGFVVDGSDNDNMSPIDGTLAAIARYFAALDENEVPGIFLMML